MRNRIKCFDCETVIESKYRHDFVYCKCENVFVDGGTSYFRAGAKNSNWAYMNDDDTFAEGI